jgi:hypothetical protein
MQNSIAMEGNRSLFRKQTSPSLNCQNNTTRQVKARNNDGESSFDMSAGIGWWVGMLSIDRSIIASFISHA